MTKIKERKTFMTLLGLIFTVPEIIGSSQSSQSTLFTKDAVFKDTDSFGNGYRVIINSLHDRIEKLEDKFNQLSSKFTTLENNLLTISTKKEEASTTPTPYKVTNAINEYRYDELAKKVKELDLSLDVDQNYWNSSTQCGGILISQAGQISYSEPYRPSITPVYQSSCVWTIRTNNRANIQLVLSGSSVVTVTEFMLSKDGTHSVKNTTIGQARTFVFDGPVILVSSSSRIVSLTWSGFGRVVHQDIEFHHYHLKTSSGRFSTSHNSTTSQIKGQRIFSTFAITTSEMNKLMEMDIQLPKSCTNASFNLQIGGEALENGKAGNYCCVTNNCNVQRYSLDGWFVASHSSLASYNDDIKLQWNIVGNHSASDSVDKCGGVVMGKKGRISYKKFGNYQHNERCVWVIYPFPRRSIVIKSFTNGFESVYDHLTIHEIDVDQGVDTVTSSSNRTYKGRVVLLSFYSDSSVIGRGFDLTWEAVGPSDFDRSFKNEKIVHNRPDATTADIKLNEDGFYLFVLTNGGNDGSSVNISVSKKSSTEICLKSRLQILGTTKSHIDIKKSLNPCTLTRSDSWSPDGIGLIFLEKNSVETQLEIRITWSFTPPTSAELVSQNDCGGVIHGTRGQLIYKMDMNYANGERCIWLIHSPTSEKITLKLLKDGFEECCDYILINKIDPILGQVINNSTFALTKSNNTQTFDGNLLVVTFKSDSSVVGRGFILNYSGEGIKNYPYKFKPMHKQDLVGTFQYKRKDVETIDWDNDYNEMLEEEHEILVLAYNAPIEPGEENAAIIFNVTLEDISLGVDENCESDILNFYISPSRDGFYLAESYPKFECHKTLEQSCENCVKSKLTENDTIPHAFSSMYTAFLGIYKPVKASTITNQTFRINWLSSSGCGGILLDEEGRIAYKLSTRYKNSEQCIWTVNSPQASYIRFFLSTNAFESCCDNIILTPLDQRTGSVGESKILGPGSTVAIVQGPVVFVTFRSDGSVTGEGFALSYTRFNVSTGLSTPNYRHYHLQRRNSSFEVPKRRAGDIITITFSPEVSKNESFLRAGNKISIENLQLSVNNATCTSDTFKFFEAFTQTSFNASNSYSADISNNSCSSNNDTDTNFWNWKCDTCFENQTRSEQLMVKTTYPAFIAIYKSVASSDEELRLEWTDIPRVTETSTTTTRSRIVYG